MAANPDSVFQSLDNGNSPLELLMIGSSPDDAARCAAALRNSGQPVRMESTETREGLMRLLETEPADLVTINADSETLPPDVAIEMVREENPSASIILLSEHPPKWAEYASKMALRDLLHSISTGRLIFAIQREYQTLLLRQELARTRRKLESTEARFQKLLKSSRDAVAYLHEGVHIQSNPVYLDLFGLSPEDIRGLTMMDLIAPEDRNQLKRTLKRAHREERTVQDLLFRHRNGGTFRADMEILPSEVEGETCVQIIIRPKNPEGESWTGIDQDIERDPQTGLLNRNAFIGLLENALADSIPPKGGLLMEIVIDNFAELCEREGTEKGDCLIYEAAEALRKHFGNDPLSRFGDHEFLALTHAGETADEVAAECLEALRRHDLRKVCKLQEAPEFRLGVISTASPDNPSVQELIRRCRRASRKAWTESAGRPEPIGGAVDLDPSASLGTDVDTNIVGLIDDALKHDGFRLLYQPIVSLEGDTRENYSTFVRLLDASGKERKPDWFYRHASQSERLAEIDRWVIRHAIGELATHRNEGKKINFHITLSRDGALDDSMLLWVCDCLREFKAKGGWLYFQFELELLKERPAALLRLTEGLRKINCKLSCNGIEEDFDEYPLLSEYQIDLVRFAPSLTATLATSPDRQERIAEINTNLQERNIKTVATGIEHADTLALLWNIGVNYIQGYFLQEPAPGIDILEG